MPRTQDASRTRRRAERRRAIRARLERRKEDANGSATDAESGRQSGPLEHLEEEVSEELLGRASEELLGRASGELLDRETVGLLGRTRTKDGPLGRAAWTVPTGGQKTARPQKTAHNALTAEASRGCGQISWVRPQPCPLPAHRPRKSQRPRTETKSKLLSRE